MSRITSHFPWILRITSVLLALLPIVVVGCSSDPTGAEEDNDDCQTVGLLVICGADTTRVDTTGTGSP